MDCELDDLLTFMFPEILTEVVDLIFFFSWKDVQQLEWLRIEMEICYQVK